MPKKTALWTNTKERYLHDPMFHKLVDALYHGMLDETIRADDIELATELAQEKIRVNGLKRRPERNSNESHDNRG